MELGVQLAVAGAGEADLDDLTRSLAEELRDSGVDRVALAEGGEGPPGAKGFGLAAVGSMVLQFLGAGGLGQLAEVLTAFLQRDSARTLTLSDGERTLELTGVSARQQRAALDAWLAQAAARNPAAAGDG